jgi:hypothetical protein
MLTRLLSFKKVKSVLKMIFFLKNKMALPPCGTVVGHAAVAHDARGLAPCHATLPPDVLSCRRSPRRQRLNAVGCCRRGVRWQMYISRNFLFVHLFYENQRKNI